MTGSMSTPRTDEVRRTLESPELHDLWEQTFLSRPAHERGWDRAFDALPGLLGAPAGARVLDAGCGLGSHAIRLARRGLQVSALDFSPTAVEGARRNAASAGVADRVQVAVGDLLDLPVDTASQAHVICWGVLMHVPEIGRAVGELARVLAPGGRLAISELNGHAPEAAALRLLGRKSGIRHTRVPAGFESSRETAAGRLLVRQLDVGWVVRELAAHGVVLRHRMAGQVTEAYAFTQGRLRRVTNRIDALNERLLLSPRIASVALGNVLVFERPVAAAGPSTTPQE
jgi:ubiquinone/menaquinone biosynthesis C-methylase UbiE